MKRFKKILYYTDDKWDNVSALKQAVKLALHNKARLTVLGVLDGKSRFNHPLISAASSHNLNDMAFNDMLVQLEKLVKPERQEGLDLKIEALSGTPFLEIIRAVLAHQYDLVIVASEINGQNHPLLGSTSLRLMRKCPCPVWVIKDGAQRRFGRILAAVNPDPYDEEHSSVNTKVLELAGSLALTEESELWIMHAWNVKEEEALRRWHVHLQDVDVDRIVRDTEAMHQVWLNDLLTRHPLSGISHKVHLLRGEPDELIIDFAAHKEIDLIVMGTVGRTGIPGFLIGSTAETVFGQVQCSVLTVKPDGFVSPVKLKEGNK